MAVVAGMKKSNDHAEPTKVERYKEKEEEKETCCVYTVNLQMTEINEDFKAFLYI